jgi:hypothetical protein
MKMNKIKFSILIGLTFAIIVGYGLTIFYPNLEDLWRENFEWNGLSKFYANSKPTKIDNLDKLKEITPSDTTLLFIGPSKEFTQLEANQIHEYLKYGGRVILADDFGSGNQLLKYLETPIRFDNRLLKDQFFRDKNSVMPLISVKKLNINTLVFNHATALIDVNQNDILAKSSPFSTLSTNTEILSNDYKSYPVIAETTVEKGKLILISDSSFVINSMINRADNKLLLSKLVRGTLIIDESHVEKSNLTLLQELLTKVYTLLGNYEVRYGMIIGFILLIFRFNLTMQEQVLDPIEEILKIHPEYNKDMINRLEKERRKERT